MEASITNFSRRFLEFLREHAPDLHGAARPAVDKQGKPTGFLLLELPSPNPAASGSLWITTEDDEITAGFDMFHTHFGPWDESVPETQSFLGAISLARDIVAERVLVASWWFEGAWCGSQMVEVGFTPERPEYISGHAVARVRSWSGIHDR